MVSRPSDKTFDKRYANWNLRDVSETVIFRDSVRPEFIDGDILHHRCDTREQYERVVASHAAMKAKVLSVRDENIGVVSPFIHGLKAFWHSFVREGVFLKVKSAVKFQCNPTDRNFLPTLPRES